MTKTIGSITEFKERYVPIAAMAEMAIKLTKQDFWVWFMQLPEEQRVKVKAEMERIATSHFRAHHRILDMLGY